MWHEDTTGIMISYTFTIYSIIIINSLGARENLSNGVQSVSNNYTSGLCFLLLKNK